MGSAVLAGAVSDVICNPMFVVRTRLQTEALHSIMSQTTTDAASRMTLKKTPTGMLDTIKLLYLEGGIPIFWRGMSANLIGLSHAAVQFPTYELLKKLLKRDKRQESAVDLLLASGLSKMTASLLTYPHEVVRSRMMDARAPTTTTIAAMGGGSGLNKVGLISTCQRIYATEGLFGFYSGLSISLIRVIPNTCITFLTYEMILRLAKQKIEESRHQQRE
jgi:solute carrier family 25 (mitochondrial folate transporter), member 32